jgi:thioester reductase-like protein
VTAIFHVGAWVNFVMPYGELRASNVLGTADLLRLATRTRRIPFHFVSSSSVFASPELAGREMSEAEVLADPTMLPNGYAQSKWAAEGLVRAASDKGLRATIFRPAFVGFDSTTGVHNPTDVPSLLFSAMAKLDVAPDVEFALDLVHVDAVVRDLVDLACKPGAQGTFHLSHPAPLPRFSNIRATLVRNDPRLTVVSLREFVGRLGSLPAAAPERALLQMLGTEGRWSVLDSLAVDAVPILGRARTDAALGAPAPHLSDDAVLRYWQRLRDPS